MAIRARGARIEKKGVRGMFIKIAKIDRICPISGDIRYSVLDESRQAYGRRQSESHILRNISSDEAEAQIAKKHRASLVSEEEFSEFLSLFQEEDEERIAHQSAINEAEEKERFYESLTGVRLKIYNDLGLEGAEWRKAVNAIDDEWRRRYCKIEPKPWWWSGDGENGWQPLGG